MEHPPPHYIAQDVLAAIMQAANELERRKPNMEKALAVLAPWRDLERIEGLPAQTSSNLLSLVCSVVGDAYREAGDAPLAASWYRRASTHRQDGGYVDIYADIVIAHRLSEHYEHALDCLRFAAAAWQGQPWHVRAFGHTWAFYQRLKRPWTLRQYRELRLRARSFETSLAALIAEEKEQGVKVEG